MVWNTDQAILDHIISYHINMVLPSFKVSESKYIQLQSLHSCIFNAEFKSNTQFEVLNGEKNSTCRLASNKRECCNPLALRSQKKKKKEEGQMRTDSIFIRKEALQSPSLWLLLHQNKSFQTSLLMWPLY